MSVPPSAPTACQSWQLSLWAAYAKDSSATILSPFDEYTTSHINIWPSRSVIVMTHIGSRRRRRATERAGPPLRHNSAHSPRVTPVDIAAGRLDVLGGMHRGPQGQPAISCAATKCQHAGRGHVPALYLRVSNVFIMLCPK